MPVFFVNLGALTAARAVQAISQVIALPYFARVLQLEDFALIALAMTVVNFTNVLSDAGINRSLIRQTTFCRDEWSSVFWMLSGIGLALALGVVAFGQGMAVVMEMPPLSGLIAALAPIPLLLGLKAPFSAALERAERFGVIAAISIVASLAALLLAVALAANGAGVWALAAQQIAIPAIMLGAMAAVSSFRPRVVFSRQHVREHVSFGRDTVLVSLLFTLQRQAPVIMIGRVLGAVPLGLYAMNERLMRLPRLGLAGPFGQVVYVKMARDKDDPDRLGRLFVASIRLVAFLVVPGMVMLSAAAEPIFVIVFSEKWREVGTIFTLLSLAVMLEVSTSAVGGLFNATGRTWLRVRMALERAVYSLAFFILALPYGIEAAVASQSVFMLLYLRRQWHWAERCAPFDVGAAAWGLALPFLTSLPLAICLYFGAAALGAPDVAYFGFMVLGTVVAMALSALLGRRALKEAMREVRR